MLGTFADREGTSGFMHAIGLGKPFSSPVFLGAMMLLGLSTAACSVDRTRTAMRVLRSDDPVPSSVGRALRSVAPLCVAQGDATVDLGGVMRTHRLKVSEHDGVLRGEVGRWSVLGSPLFHWALTALFVFVALGQLTRAEGTLRVVVGEQVSNTDASYFAIKRGPLNRSAYADTQVAVTAFDASARKGDIDLGGVATVALIRGGEVVAQGRVYPNHPLRYRSLLVHPSNRGYVASVTLRNESGGDAGSTRVFFEPDDRSASGFVRTGIGVGRSDGTSFSVTFTPVSKQVAREAGAKGTDAFVRLDFPLPSGESTVVVLGVGASADLGEGSVSLDSVTPTARLVIAEDASVYPIYLSFLAAIIGIGVAVLVPHRLVWLTQAPGADGLEVRLVTRHGRSDPAFVATLEDDLREACGVKPDEPTTPESTQ